MHNKRAKLVKFWLLGTLCMMGLFSQAPITVQSAESSSVSFSISKISGTGLGKNIEGNFKLKGTGSSSITNLTLYFNGVQVNSVADNEMAYSFDTKDYPVGTTNVTLIGTTSTGEQSQSSQEYEFMTPNSTIWIVVIIFIIAIPLSIWKRKRKSRNHFKKQDQNTTEGSAKPKVEIKRI